MPLLGIVLQIIGLAGAGVATGVWFGWSGPVMVASLVAVYVGNELEARG